MNLILIVSDTLRRDHLGCYGSSTMQTPTLDRLAQESMVFDRAYSGSFPTLPCRAELFTGRFVFPYLNWGPLPQNEVLLSETLAKAGYTCTAVTDNLPLCRSDYGYSRGFHSLIRIRGQWYDNFQPVKGPFEWPCTRQKLRDSDDGRIIQYLRNTSIRRREEDCFAPQVVREAVHWLEQNHDRSPFFLYLDIFDPHEPWDPPQSYVDLYDPDGVGENIIYPIYGPSGVYSPEDLQRIRALYAGEVTLMDRWLGKLLEAVDALGRRDDTVIAFLSDHGILLGERGLIGKMGRKDKDIRGWPTYCEVSRIPLLIRAPGIAPGRSNAFVHPGDVTPTLLDLAGVRVPSTMKTASLAPLLKREQERVRDAAVSSWSLRGWSVHRPSMIRTDEWAMVFWRSGIAPELYHLPTDPGETTNVFPKHQAVARDLHRRYVEFLQTNDAPPGQLLPRRFFMNWDRTTREELM